MSVINKKVQFNYRIRSNGRRPSGWPMDGAGIPIRITRYIPMKLKDVDMEKINSSSKSERDVACIPQMMKLFDCYERHDFSATQCATQAQALEKCFNEHSKSMAELKASKKNKTKS